jgi:fibronectin type 3 domain-containing protein
MKRISRIKIVTSMLLVIFLFLLVGCSNTIPTNNAPSINSIPITNSLVNVLYTYNVEATDADEDILTYSLTSNLTGMTIDSSIGIISWTPNAVGSYDVILKVSDGESFDTQSFTLEITLTAITTPTNNTPSINSIPITNSLVNVLYTYNVEATDADEDILTYSLTSNLTGMTIDSSTGIISWTPNAVGSYDVSLKVSDGESFDTQSFTLEITLTAITTLSPPTNVSATDGDYTGKVSITWSTVTGATYYQVYRSSVLFIKPSAVSSWQTGVSYDDTDVKLGTTYYYWVKAATSSSGDDASALSKSDSGYAIIPLSPPEKVSATDGTYTDKVYIKWGAVTGATHYQVYRATFSSGLGRKAISGWQTDASYDDIVSPGVTYWYWVKAATSSSGDDASAFSKSDSGYVDYPLPPLKPPTGVNASNIQEHLVQITWNSVTGANYYQVYRALFSSGLGRKAISGWQIGDSYDDWDVNQMTIYYYWVKAADTSSGGRASDFSASDSCNSGSW